MKTEQQQVIKNIRELFLRSMISLNDFEIRLKKYKISNKEIEKTIKKLKISSPYLFKEVLK